MRKLPFFKIISDLWKIKKTYVLLYLFLRLKDVPIPLIHVLYTKYLIDNLLIGKCISLLKIFSFILSFFIFEIVLYLGDSWFNIKYEPKYKEYISNSILTEFLEKSGRISLKNYETKEFCDKNALAVNELIPTYFNIFYSFVDIIIALLTMLSFITVIFIGEKIILVSSILVVVFYFIVNSKSNKLKLSQLKQLLHFSRFKRYILQLSTTYENIKNMRVFSTERFCIKKLNETGEKCISIITKFSDKLILYSNISHNIFSLFKYVTTMYCAYIVWIGKITIGSFSGMTQSIFSFMNSLKKLSDTLVLFNNHLNQYNIINELESYLKVNQKQEELHILDKSKSHSIEFKNLSFSYDDNPETNVLKDISFNIHPNEKVAIIGENASGKSTLISLLLRLYEPPDNTIFIDGIDIKKYSSHSIFNNFSVLQQKSNNYAVTVAENVCLGLDSGLDVSKVEESLKLGKIYEKIHSTDKGIFSEVTKNFADDGLSLSGGENQRLSIRRFFYRDAPILILDEYERWLDRDSNEMIFKNIMNFSNNKTLIMITHNPKYLSLMDKIIRLKNGSIESITVQQKEK